MSLCVCSHFGTQRFLRSFLLCNYRHLYFYYSIYDYFVLLLLLFRGIKYLLLYLTYIYLIIVLLF